MSHFKIHKGTGQLTGEALCLSCRHATIRTDRTGEYRQCDRFSQNDGRITSDVYDCSGYYNRSLSTLSSMQSIAWTLLTDKGQKIGFKPPAKLPYPPDMDD